DARQQAHEIVLAAQREHRIDEIVADAFLTENDFEAVGEEREKVPYRIVGWSEVRKPLGILFDWASLLHFQFKSTTQSECIHIHVVLGSFRSGGIPIEWPKLKSFLVGLCI